MQRSWCLFAWAIVALCAPLAVGISHSAAAEDGFVSIFDGKSLDGWDGNPDFWSVKDGCITGTTTKENPTKGNTFIIWRKGTVGDFELKLKFRITGGNSGIQYRSREPRKWVINGYQADFDAGGGYTGSLYEEGGRGMLAERGNKVTIGEDGKKKGEKIDVKAALDALKENKEKNDGWNTYEVIAKGNHLVQKVNGVVTADVTDSEPKKSAAAGLLALQLHAGPPMVVQFKDIVIKQEKSAEAAPAPAKKEGAAIDALRKIRSARVAHAKGQEFFVAAAADTSVKKKVVLLAGGASHGFGAHDHTSGCALLANALNKSGLNIEATVIRGWPKDEKALDDADCVVMYCDGGGGHMANKHLEQIDALSKKGCGVVCLHYGVETTKGPAGEAFLRWIGGYFEPHWSVNPHWTAKFKKFPDHQISRGVKPFEINDEWYFHMRFRPEMKGVTPILTAMPPESTMKRGDGAHSGNPHVKAALLERKEPQHMAWASENEGGSRGFGFTGGHVHWNWGNDQFRKVVLNAIVWCAKVEVPKEGVASTTPTIEEMLSNHDEKVPENFDKAKYQKMFDAWNKPAEKSATAQAEPKK